MAGSSLTKCTFLSCSLGFTDSRDLEARHVVSIDTKLMAVNYDEYACFRGSNATRDRGMGGGPRSQSRAISRI